MEISSIYMICMRKQRRALGTFLFRNLSQRDWFLLGNYLLDLKVLLVQKWITWYVVPFNYFKLICSKINLGYGYLICF